MKIEWIFLNILLNVFQVYIYMMIGIWGYYKSILSKQTTQFISKTVAFYLFPFYNIIELSRVATAENMKIFWILALSTLLALCLGFVISLLSTKVFKLDQRTSYTSSLLTSLPALGSFPLVLGKSLCMAGGPLADDPRCSEITGFMVINLMIFQIQMFFTGYSIVMKDIELVKPFEEKLHYIWHIFLRKRGEEDIVVLDLFEKYLKKNKLAKEKYRDFVKEYKVIHLRAVDFEFKLPNRVSSCEISNDSFSIADPNNIEVKKNYFLDYSAISNEQSNLFVEVNPDQRIEEHSRLPSFNIQMILKNIQIYYDRVFQIIEEDLNTAAKSDYGIEKNRIVHNLQDFPTKFPIVRSFHVDTEILKEVNQEFANYELAIKSLIPEFKLTEYTRKSIVFILGKVYYPPIIGCFLGLLIGLSGMRDILFSENHYLKNFFDICSVVTVVNVPFIYVTAGFAFAALKGINRDMILTKKDMLMGVVIRFLILPCIGLLWVYIWTTYYGGIVLESKVVRLSIFIPFCLPISPLIVVFLNIVNFYLEETAYQMLVQHIAAPALLTVMLLVYFITLGS
jgi:predicted permease